MPDEIATAFHAFYRSMRRKGYDDCQISTPSRYGCHIVEDRVILTNVNGYMATYHTQSKRITHSKQDQRLAEH